MKYFTKKGEAEPYANGTKLTRKSDGRGGTILRECHCTAEWLHYEVMVEGEWIRVYQHPDITLLFDITL